jgi:hypothetical protein
MYKTILLALQLDVFLVIVLRLLKYYISQGGADVKKRPEVDFGCRLGWEIDF